MVSTGVNHDLQTFRTRYGKAQETNLCKGQRWVKNVLLVDIRKAGLLPPDCENERVSNDTASRNEKPSESSDTVFHKQTSHQSIEQYISINRLGKCFVTGCSFSTKSFGSLLYHVLCSHREVNKFSCQYCSHICPLSDMVEHLNMHGPAMFQCKYCSHHNFSQLKVLEHVKSIHIGRPLITVELRDYKGEDFYIPKADDKDEEVDVECMKVEPSITKEKTFKWEDKGDTDLGNGSNFLKTDHEVDGWPNNQGLNSNCCDSGVFVGEQSRYTANEGNVFFKELDSAFVESKLSERNNLINASGDLKSTKSESKRTKEKSGKTLRKNMKLPSQSLLLSCEPKIEVIQKKINLKSTAHNYHSSELHSRKDALEKNWQCGFCDYVGLYNNMIAHAESAHEVKYQFQCSRCSIFIASRGYVESHCVIFHPKVLVTLIAYYYLPGSRLPYEKLIVKLPDGQLIYTPVNPVFSQKIPEVHL